jgi:hypothetical protein
MEIPEYTQAIKDLLMERIESKYETKGVPYDPMVSIGGNHKDDNACEFKYVIKLFLFSGYSAPTPEYIVEIYSEKNYLYGNCIISMASNLYDAFHNCLRNLKEADGISLKRCCPKPVEEKVISNKLPVP